jgi:hypothetical protein
MTIDGKSGDNNWGDFIKIDNGRGDNNNDYDSLSPKQRKEQKEKERLAGLEEDLD